MEPPVKRQKKSQGLADTNEDYDELTLAPDELNQRRDPVFQLEQGRTLAANKLKFRLEEVIAKYSRDFTGIGDEIDLITGQVVVDNGHVRSMRSEKDTGAGDDVDEDSEEEEERILRGVKAADRAPRPESASSMIPRDPWQVAGPSWPARPATGASPRLTSLFPNQSSFMTPSRSFSPLGYGNTMSMSVDPVWQAPELPESAFANRFGASGQHLEFGMSLTTRKLIKKSLPPPVSPESDEEDALLGVSGNAFKKNAEKESPLIKQNFPSIDSSPNEDHVHKKEVSDLIGNLPSSPPSIQRPKITKPRGLPSKLKETQAAGSDTEPKKKSCTQQDKGARQDEANPGVNGKILQVNEAEHSSWDEGDLKDFRDITGKSVKPAGQMLFVDIRTTKSQSSTPTAMESHGNKAPKSIQNTNTRPPAHDNKFVVMDTLGDQAVTAERNVEKSTASNKQRQAKEKFKRNVVDPSFAFSDGETMLPKKRGRGRLRLEPARIAVADMPKQGPSIKTKRAAFSNEARDASWPEKVQQSDLNTESSQGPQQVAEPQVEQAMFEKNDIDPSFAFSDDEVLLPRRPRRGARDSELATRAEGLSEEAFSATRGPSVNPLVESRAAMSAAQVAPERRPGRKPSKAAFGSKETQHETPVPSTGNGQPIKNGSQEVLQAVDAAGSQPSLWQKKQEPIAGQPISAIVPSIVQGSLQATSEAESFHAAASPPPRRESVEAATEQPSLPSAQLKPTTEDRSARSGGPKARRRRSSRRQSSELGEPSPPEPPADAALEQLDPNKPTSHLTTTAASQPPATPRRKPKGTPKKPTSALELISLLSDDEDDEDEISFDLADFTPSGHHRILVHRPFPRLLAPTSSYSAAKAAASTTKKNKNKNKKKRASLFGPYSAPRTPGSARRGSTSKKGGTSSLARSVVRARRPRRHSIAAASPSGSVVQTPGGTRRRCGADGFRCERDFCFVCL